MDGQETEIPEWAPQCSPTAESVGLSGSRHLNFLTDNTGAISQVRPLAEEELN